MMGERRMDALVTVFTGQLSGWYFLAPFQKERDAVAGEAFYSDPAMFRAQEHFVGELARLMQRELPGSLNVNGVDHHPWFDGQTCNLFAVSAASSTFFTLAVGR
jgi:hypothetical protein